MDTSLLSSVCQWLQQCCVVCTLIYRQETSNMQTSTILVLACLIAVVVAQAHQEPQSVDAAQESIFDTPEHDRSSRNKRGLLLLKKKLILGALGLKAAKVGAAGVVGALALKAKAKPKTIATHSYYHHGW